MARQVGVSIENNFVKGLITEFTPLQFPTNACTETFNCIFYRTGLVSRRKGLDIETDGTRESVSKHSETSEATRTFVWKNAGGQADAEFVVQQHGRFLYFYDVSSSINLSLNKLDFTVDLTTFSVADSSLLPDDFACDFSQGNGDLLVVNAATDPFYVSYSSNDGSFAATKITLKERDTRGLDDGWGELERKEISTTTLKTTYPEHYYNLLNQGWGIGSSTDGFITDWRAARGDIPSNSDIPRMYMSSDTSNLSTSTITNLSRTGLAWSSSPAPKGHFILNVGSADRLEALGFENFGSGSSITIETDVVSTLSRTSGSRRTNASADGAYYLTADRTAYYDGDTTQNDNASTKVSVFDGGGLLPAQKPILYAGKDFGSNPKRIDAVRVRGTTNFGYGSRTPRGNFQVGELTSGTFTIQLRGSGTAPNSDGSNGTLLGSISFSNSTNESSARTINVSSSSLKANSYRFVWVRVVPPDFTSATWSMQSALLAELEIDVITTNTTTTVVADVADLNIDVFPQRPTAVEFINGRVFYSGIETSRFSNTIYFSQLIEARRQYGRCYQQNDPTSHVYFDLLPTDGGTITIKEMGGVKRIIGSQQSILVFASNGIWEIRPGAVGSFSASDYSVRKISSIGTSSPLSFVDVDGLPCWWGEDGINILTYDERFNSFSVKSLTDETLKSFILAVPSLNKKYVKGTYDPNNKVIYWIYNDTESLQEDEYFTYNKILIYDILTNAFYPWTIEGDVTVTDVTFLFDREVTDLPIIKFTCLEDIDSENTYIFFAEHNNSNYTNWENYVTLSGGDTHDYSSYFITGYRLDGETQRFFQPNYLFVFLQQENNASVFVQSIFDFSTSGNSGKWSSKQQAYNDSLSFRSTSISRLKMRGKGRTFQLKFSSETGKPFNIYGWSSFQTGNSSI